VQSTFHKKRVFFIIPQNHIYCPATEQSPGGHPGIQLGLKQQSCERLISWACMGLSPMGGWSVVHVQLRLTQSK